MEIEYKWAECWPSLSRDWVKTYVIHLFQANVLFFFFWQYRFGAAYHDGYGINCMLLFCFG